MKLRDAFPVALGWLALMGLAAPAWSGGAVPSPTLSSSGPFPALDRGHVDAVKVAVALCAALVLIWRFAVRRTGRSASRRSDLALAVLGIAGAACFWNLLQFHHPGYAHPHDNFHYYLGSKYFPELGYQRLYPCTVVADHEAGLRRQGKGGAYRDLAINRMVPATEILDDPARCKRHFSPTRWREFTADVAWMRNRLPTGKWVNLLNDHGYNATPAWGMLGGLLTNSAPLSSGQLRALTLIDPGFLLAMWMAVIWAFGWRAACVGLVFWGTNDIAGFEWVGGGILRQDWLAACIVGICLLRRNHLIAGGFLIGWATLLRVFPGCLLLGLAVHAGLCALRGGVGEVRRTHLRIALGAGLAIALVIPLSSVVVGRGDSSGADARGAAVWLDFANNSRLHLATPLQNHIGLQTLLSYDPDQTARRTRDIRKTDPFETWKSMRRATYERRAPLYAAIVLAFLGLFTWSVRGAATWEVAILSVGLIPFATELTCYYYAILLAYAGLWEERQEIGTGLVILAALSWGLTDWFHYYDEIFTASSAAILAFALLATLRVALRAHSPRQPASI